VLLSAIGPQHSN